ncbi:protein Skeletor, isoforms B/C-like [Amphiura filiformis]|uniref:protein Skeletor, isoforms B/C-like n=1 Tax=Amphiura filiformis TaxID=82378 RepID=UPI003B20C920
MMKLLFRFAVIAGIGLSLWPDITVLALTEDYFGKLIGDLSSLAHGVKGTVYVATNQRLYIRDFYYDGLGPDAYVWMGSESSEPSPQGEIVPVNGSYDILDGFSDGVLRVDLPMKTLTEYKWLSIWCREFTVDFGNVMIPSDFEAPAEVSLGSLGFTPRVHNVYARDVIIINDRQISLVELDYDGNGPDAFYWAGEGETPTANGFPLENEFGSTEPLERGSPFNDKNVTVTIPEDKGNVFGIGHVGLWCVLAVQDFGHVDIPDAGELNIPPYDPDVTTTMAPIPATYEPPSKDNCEVLIDDTYQVRWTIEDDTINIALSGRIKPGNYLAFGLSGSDSTTRMVGSDVTVAWLNELGTEANAVDYYLSAYQQCVLGDGPGSGTGACPDDVSKPSGTDDVTVGDYSNLYGIITISYTRPLNTGDTTGDQVIPIDEDVYIAWAVGPINPSGLAAKHRQQPSTDFKINFGRQNSSCPPFSTGEDVELPPWEIEPVEDVEEFMVDIGQAGGQQGYEGITGSPGWGIAWYVNGLIIPEITVRRNKKYTFTINGGDDPDQTANYHPFYISNDEIGGYAQKTPEDKELYTSEYYGDEEKEEEEEEEEVKEGEEEKDNNAADDHDDDNVVATAVVDDNTTTMMLK